MKKILLMRFKNPVFQKIRHPLHKYPPLTLKHIQLCLEQKFNLQTKLIDSWIYNNTQNLTGAAMEFRPDCLIAYIEKPAEKQNFLAFSSAVQYHNLLKIGIGPDITARHHEYLLDKDIFDFCIPGEPEEAISFFFEKLARHSIKKEDLIEFYKKEMVNDRINIVGDLTQLSPLDFTQQELRAYPFTYPLRLNQKLISGYTMTSRGCPHNCVFCSPMVRKSYGKTIRHRPVSTVITEISNMARQGANFISFEDDNFGADQKWLSDFLHALIEKNIKIKWSAQTRIDAPLNDKNLALMKKAGCILLQLGVETASEKLLKTLQKTTDSKNWKNKCLRIFKKIKAHGIATCALFIIGIPQETDQDIEESIRLAINLDPDLIKLHLFTLYPGCQAYDNNKKNISLADLENMHHHITFKKSPLNKKRNYFYAKFILRPSFLFTHTRKYCGFYLKNLVILRYLVKNTISMMLPSKNNSTLF
ncbi:MAG: radical SAM protein [Candidatus Omnitrophota bacterium]